MCTLSAITKACGALRVVMNRDESVARARAFAPKIIPLTRRLALMPRDAQAGGTWIGVNELGLIVALLNQHPPGAVPLDRPRSRGELVVRLLDCDDLDDAASAISGSGLRLYGRFRAVVFDSRAVLCIVSDGTTCVQEMHGLNDRPWFWTSSSLGDDIVTPYRAAKFMSLVEVPSSERQDLLHADRGAGCPERGILMSRADARTVSITVIERGPTRSRMTYHDLLQPADSCEASIARATQLASPATRGCP